MLRDGYDYGCGVDVYHMHAKTAYHMHDKVIFCISKPRVFFFFFAYYLYAFTWDRAHSQIWLNVFSVNYNKSNNNNVFIENRSDAKAKNGGGGMYAMLYIWQTHNSKT